MFDYIEVFYNRERLHSTLGYRSPEEYEQDYYEEGDCQRKEVPISFKNGRLPMSTCPPKRRKPR